MRRTLSWPRRLAAWSLPLLALLAAHPAFATKVTFRYQPVIGGVSSVAVAGSFNGWDAAANPLADADKDGIWSADVEVAPGRIEYKFVVNGDQWFTDENAAETSSDGFGGQNAVLVVADQPLSAGYGSAPKEAAKASEGLRRVTFSFKPKTPATEVSVAGTFNDWTVGKTPLSDPDGDGVWTTTLLLSPGSYQYKFVVGSNGWTQDREGQDAESDDGFGGKNSIRNVDDRYPSIAVAKGDGDVFGDGIDHRQGANEVNALGGGKVQFTARAHLNDVQGVDLVTWPGGKETAAPMSVATTDRVYEYWRVTATLPAGTVPYAFRYRDGAKTLYLTSAGLAPKADANRFTFDPQRFPAFITPDWVKNGIVYQIFPDRFRNGNPGNDQDFHEWYYEGKKSLPASGRINPEFQEYYHLSKDWNDVAALTHAPHTPDGRDWMLFYGGDIAGVKEKLDYLQSLGVTILYFNPLFEAKSTHKYDAASYQRIDPHFASQDEFRAFVAECRKRGIHVVLDIVYNHCGNCSDAFRDVAEKGEKSAYWSWFDFKKWPLPAGWPNVGTPWKPADYYDCWWGFGDLPDLSFDLARYGAAEMGPKEIADASPNIGLVRYLLDTTEYWLKNMDCDGVRLDVANEVPFWFWKLFNARVKKVKPDAWIVGELWGNASEYVRPGVYDAVMNYAYFRDPVLRFLGSGQGTAAEFDALLNTGRQAYPSQSVEVQMNLIDSHDTPRFLNTAGGNVKRLKLAAVFQMTYVGAPAIYYGDEIALDGGKDPDCRRTFPWNEIDQPRRADVLAHYRALGQLRSQHAALRTGEFRTVLAEGKTYAYARKAGGEEFLVVLNAGVADANVTIDTAPWGGKLTAVDMLSHESVAWTGKAAVAIPGESGRVFQITR